MRFQWQLRANTYYCAHTVLNTILYYRISPISQMLTLDALVSRYVTASLDKIHNTRVQVIGDARLGGRLIEFEVVSPVS